MRHVKTKLKLSTLVIIASLSLTVPSYSLADTVAIQQNIQSGSLVQAINQLSKNNNTVIAFNPNILEGMQTQGLKGQYTFEQGLTQLLANQAIRWGYSNGSYSLQPIAGKGPVIHTASNKTGDAHQIDDVVVSASSSGANSAYTEHTGSFTTSGPVTSATGLNLSLRETPQSVSVMTRARMNQQNLTSLPDILKQTTGITVSNQTSNPLDGMTFISSRGYSVDQIQVDGVGNGASANYPMRESLSSLDTAMYDSVTVVRGATGLMTGKGDPSASVNMVRKRPTDIFQASLTGTFGRWGKHRYVADMGGPLTQSGVLRGRLVAVHDEGGSWVDRYNGKRNLFYGIAEVDLGEKTLLSFSLEKNWTRLKGLGGYLSLKDRYFEDESPTPFNRYVNLEPNWVSLKIDTIAINSTLEHRFNEDWVFKANHRFSKLDRQNHAISVDVPRSGVFDYDVWLNKNKFKTHSFDVNLHGNYSLWGLKNNLVIGVNGSIQKSKTHPDSLNLFTSISGNAQVVDGHVFYGPKPDWDEYATNSHSTSQDNNYGIYLANRTQATDKLSFILGTRWSKWNYRYETLPGDMDYNPADEVERQSETAFVPYAGIIYDFTDTLSGYASYTEIFRPQAYSVDINDKQVPPQTGFNYELGLKGEWYDGRLNASIAVFQNGKKNIASTVKDERGKCIRTPKGECASEPKAKTRGRGFELEVAGEILPGWRIQTGYTHFMLREKSGKISQKRPSFNLFSTYTPKELANLTIGGGLRWISKNKEPNNKIYHTGSYAVTDLIAAYAFNKNLNMTLNLNNVFNKNYRLSSWPSGYRNEFGAKRNLTATVKYQF